MKKQVVCGVAALVVLAIALYSRRALSKVRWNQARGRAMRRLSCVLIAVMTLAGCGPNEERRAAMAEQKRIECLDRICNDDVGPKRNTTTEEALKLSGQWYIGPKEYFSSGMNGGGFYWPSRRPMFKGGDYSEKGKPFYDVAIEIFFTGRQRWSVPQVEKPWEHPDGIPPYWVELLSRGLNMKRSLLTPDLERVEFVDANHKKEDRTVFFLAVNAKRLRGQGPPILSCRLSEPMRSDDRCVGGEYWQPDVFADFRFNAKHATDWPAIHLEILRVLSLIKKVEP